MEISDIASPTYSVSSNVLRLNASSLAASTPSCDVDGHLVDFEEYSQPPSHLPARPLPKKRLTIDIDEIYDFEQQQQPHPKPPELAPAQPKKDECEQRQSFSLPDKQAIECLRLRELVEGQRARIEAMEREREFLMKENDLLKSVSSKRE
jgi:hypothetical protein